MVEPVEQLDGHTVRLVPAFRAHSTYVCPECGNAIGVGEGHVVVWPDERVDDRRHWHRHCWRVAARRGRIA
ncbi:MAG: hypothetical protein WDZ26_03730 [Nitriliruptoraceae bacterium]